MIASKRVRCGLLPVHTHFCMWEDCGTKLSMTIQCTYHGQFWIMRVFSPRACESHASLFLCQWQLGEQGLALLHFWLNSTNRRPSAKLQWILACWFEDGNRSQS